LGTLGGQSSYAADINEDGWVVGRAGTSDGGSHAFLYQAGVMRDLGTPPGAVSSDALGINNLGQIVGTAIMDPTNGTSHAFLWEEGVMYDLNTRIPPNSGWKLEMACAINDRGLIVGSGRLKGAERIRAFLLIPHSIASPSPPAAPTGLVVSHATTEAPSQLELEWTDRSDTEAGFEIQRQTAESDWTTVTTAPPNSVTYSDAGLESFIRYRYRVRAVNAAGASEWTEAAGETGIGAVLRVSPTSLAFGKQPVDERSAARSVTLTNRGTGPLTIQRISIAGSGQEEFSLGSSIIPRRLQPGESRELRVFFTPSATGSWLAELLIESDADGSPHTLALSGAGGGPALEIGLAAADLADRLEFGSHPLGAPGMVRHLTLTNTGAAPLRIRSVRLADAGPRDFSLISGHGATTLAPGRRRTLAVRFTPKQPGARGAVLTVLHNGENSPQEVTLAGEGVISEPDARAPRPVSAKLVVASLDGELAPPGPIRVAVGQSLRLLLRVRYANGAVAELTEGAGLEFSAAAEQGTFTGPNNWRPLASDAGRRITLHGRFVPRPGRKAVGARLTVTVAP
jgi:probable HAF family extracellular repeat protein